MDGAARDATGGRAQSCLEPVRNLAGGLVGEGEGTDARRIEAVMLDQKPDALRKAIGFSRAGAGQNEQRARVGFDRCPLRWRWHIHDRSEGIRVA